jgi:hypothetical protein
MTQHHLWIPFLLRALGAFLLLPLAVAWVLSRFSFKLTAERHVRGLQYEPDTIQSITLAQQAIRASGLTRAAQEGLKIHPKISLPPALTNTGVLVIGAVGSGKTNFLLPILQQIAAGRYRSLIVDVKGEFTETLNYPEGRFVLLAPWDQRGWRWDIARDITTLSQCRLFAESCIPPSDEPIWSTAARQIFTGLLHYLCITRPGQWDLMDFIELTRRSDGQLIGIIRVGNPDAERVIAQLERGSLTGQSILINLAAFLGPLADMAWSWRQNLSAPTFSVADWLAEDSPLPKGLLVQSRRRFGELSEAFINLLVSLLTDTMIDTAFPEADARGEDWRLYLFLDEIAQMRKIEALQSLSSAGRSKGLHLFVGLQSITQLKALYGPEFADVLFSNCLARYIGRTPDGESAEWLAGKLGMQEVERLADSVAYGQGGYGLSGQPTVHWVREQKRVLLPDQLASDLGPDFNKGHIRGLLSVAGWRYLLRLAWPKVHYPALRPALVTAEWATTEREDFGAQAPVSEVPDLETLPDNKDVPSQRALPGFDVSAEA